MPGKRDLYVALLSRTAPHACAVQHGATQQSPQKAKGHESPHPYYSCLLRAPILSYDYFSVLFGSNLDVLFFHTPFCA
jgi:hypothetical protein